MDEGCYWDWVKKGVRHIDSLYVDDPPLDAAQFIQDNIKGKSIQDIVYFLMKHAPDELSVVAEKVQWLAHEILKKGFKVRLIVCHPFDRIPDELYHLRSFLDVEESTSKIDIYLQGADMKGLVGMSYQTVLHELIHALVRVSLLKPNPNINPDRYKVFFDTFNEHLTERQAKGNLTEFEELMIDQNRGYDLIQNNKQKIEWSVSSQRFQSYLRTVSHDKNTSLWFLFIDAVRETLGLEEKFRLPVEKILSAAEGMFDSKMRGHTLQFRSNRYFRANAKRGELINAS